MIDDALAYILRLIAGAIQFQRLPAIRRASILGTMRENGASALAECLQDTPQYNLTGPSGETLERLTDT